MIPPHKREAYLRKKQEQYERGDVLHQKRYDKTKDKYPFELWISKQEMQYRRPEAFFGLFEGEFTAYPFWSRNEGVFMFELEQDYDLFVKIIENAGKKRKEGKKCASGQIE